MQVNIKYIDARGKEIEVKTLTQFIQLIKEKEIIDDTLLYDVEKRTWKKAGETEDYLTVVSKNITENEAKVSLPSPASNILMHDSSKDIYIEPSQNHSALVANRNKKISSILLLLSFLMLIIASALHYINLLEGVGFEIGYMGVNIILIALGATVINRLFLKKEYKDWLLVFSFLLFLVAGYRYGSILKEDFLLKKANREMIGLMESALRGENLSKKIHIGKSYGEITPAVELFNNLALRFQGIANEMAKDIPPDAVVENMLSKETFSNPRLLLDKQLKLKKLTAAIVKYEKQMLDEFDSVEQDLPRLNVPDEYKIVIMRTFSNEKSRIIHNIKSMFELKKQAFAEIGGLLGFLRKRQGQYWYQDNDIFFTSVADANKYNNYMAKIKALAVEEMTFREKFMSDSIKKVKKLRE